MFNHHSYKVCFSSPFPPIPNLKVKLGFFNCAQLCKLPSLDMVGGWDRLAPIASFDAEPPGINCASIVLNCADIIFNCASPHLQIRGGGFRSSAPHCEFRGENGLDQLGFNCVQLCSNPFRSYSPSFRDLGIFFQYTFKVNDRSLSPQPPSPL